jgi:hypothetical protein
MGSRWSCRRTRPTTTTTMMIIMTRTTIWWPDLASVRIRGWARGRQASLQPPGGLAPPAFGVGTPGSRPEERRRAEGVLDPLGEIIGATLGGQVEPHAPQEQVPVQAESRLEGG